MSGIGGSTLPRSLDHGNVKPPILIAHIVGMKETYESMTAILKVINYWECRWVTLSTRVS